jgi:3'(2'), 5'-bisphosphate nucleotidase
MNASHTPRLIQLAQEAGDRIMEIYQSAVLSANIDYKSDDSPLTLADQAAHRHIAIGLRALTPNIPILSEEGRNIDFAERKNWERFWLVDPLDGTKEFIKRNGEFTVNIALIEGHTPVWGIVHVPAKKVSYYGGKEMGAFRLERGAKPVQIEASEFNIQGVGLRFVASRSHMSEEVQQYLKQFDEPQILSMGSSLKFMLLAEGKADIYPRLAPTMEWDTAAAQAVLQAAGGQVIQHESGEPLVYNKENLLNPHFIAYGKRVEK